MTWKPTRVLTDDAIARLAALVGGPSGHQVGLVGSAANLLHQAKLALVGKGAQELKPKERHGAEVEAPTTKECHDES